MAESLAENGIGSAVPNSSPDMIVVNTCTVTREATKASRMAIRRAVRAHPEARVVVVGCYAVSDPDEVAAIDGVDVVLGNDAKDELVTILGATAATAPLLQIGMRPAPRVGPVKVRANLKVQTGCDEWCSFCIIPTTRGPLRSYDSSSIIEEARARARDGARELVLTGVHLGKFMYEQGGDERDLVRLFDDLLAIEGVQRLRLSSILSRHLTHEVVEYIRVNPRMCRYLHVPLQSGDDGVLDAMNRPYRIDEYIESVERARGSIPDLALATDVIVGFPGESDEAFEATMQVVRRLEFCKLHVFRYSARPGTPAATLPEIHPDTKKARSKALIDLGNQLRRGWLTDHLGKDLEVLVEDERVVDGLSIASGQTGDYVRVWFEGSGVLGKMVFVRALDLMPDGLRGELSG